PSTSISEKPCSIGGPCDEVCEMLMHHAPRHQKMSGTALAAVIVFWLLFLKRWLAPFRSEIVL
ncbi:hypothetical protein, partial [uncultured Gimesia sp.]|uniref:hypothetical protein n=1 Tax=uncultured Gimesia sp. TaxID=1678688 RepID=UPI00260D471A